jgi:ADP-ribosylglycohydrolase
MDNIYKNVIRNIVSKGGDTDTNACIVGAMVGAHIGIK